MPFQIARISEIISTLRCDLRGMDLVCFPDAEEKSGGELELVSRDTAQLKQPNQCFFDQVVGTRSTGGNAHDNGTGWQPEVGNDFTFLMQVVMFDLSGRDQTRRI